MANLLIKDGGAASRYLRATGDGSSGSPFSPHHVFGDGDGNALGVGPASPLYVTGGGSGSVVLTDGVDTAAIDSASRLLAAASAVITNQVSASISNTVDTQVLNQVSASISNTVTAQASILNVSIDSASRLLTVASAVITGQVSASISNTVNTQVLGQVSASIGNTVNAQVLNQVSASISNTVTAQASILNVAIDSASRLLAAASAVITNQVSASISNTVNTQVLGQVSASISNTVNTQVLGQVSASISNAVTVAQGAAGATPWLARLTDASGNALGVSAASPLYITGGAAGGTSSTDRGAYAEGSTSFTPVGGLYQPDPLALTASQSGAVRMTAQRALHTSLRDEAGNVLGVSGSPLYVTGGAAGGSVMALTDGVDTAAIDSASRLLTIASAVITNQVSASISNTVNTQVLGQVSASISNTLTASVVQSTPAAYGAAWTMRLTDGTDGAAIDSASRLLVSGSVVVPDRVSASISNTVTAQASILNVSIDSASRLLTVASAVITGQVSASISNTVNTQVLGQVSASISNAVTVAQGAAGATPWLARLTDASGNALGVSAASPLYVSSTGGAAGSSMALTDGVDTAAIDSASRLLTIASAVITERVSASISNTVDAQVLNQISASISNTLTASVVQSTPAAYGAAWTMRLTDGTDGAAIDSASRLLVSGSVVVPDRISASISNTVTTQASILNVSIDSASRLLTVASAVITGQVSASISNTLTASVVQSTPAAYGAAWTMRLTDGTDGAAVSTASGLHANLRTATGDELGRAGSALIGAHDNGVIYVNGSPLTVVSAGFSASVSPSTVIVPGQANGSIRVLGITFTTAGSQQIGWQSGSVGATASLIPAMSFANYGGMDVWRGPDAYLMQTTSTSALVINQTAAVNVRGSITYVVVPG